MNLKEIMGIIDSIVERESWFSKSLCYEHEDLIVLTYSSYRKNDLINDSDNEKDYDKALSLAEIIEFGFPDIDIDILSSPVCVDLQIKILKT